MGNDSQIKEFFDQHGYFHAKGVFSKAEIANLETAFDQIVRQLHNSGESVNARWMGGAVDKIDGGTTEITHTHNVQKFSAEWLKAWLHPGFLDVARAILGEDIILHHSKLFQKPSEKGAPFPMHQDWAYFPMKQDSMIAGIVHVSDATDEMGCLRVYPGSHKLGRLGNSKGMEESSDLKDYPLENATPVPCEKGDVVFFHYFTLHGSMPNRSDRVRKTVLAQLHAGSDEIEETHSHPYEKLVLSGFNHAMTRSAAAQTIA
jgi:phytanoyl-CoA hydroxylase